MKEEWKDIVGFEGLYQISNMGRVKSLNYRKTGREKIRKACKNSDGYLYLCLYKNNKAKYYTIHILVAQAFIPNPYNLPQINHIDENKENNHVDNLEWITCKENINHGTHNKRSAENRRNDPKRSKPVIAIDKVTGLIVEFPSAREAERVLRIDQSSITKCCKGRLKSTGGFAWYYADTTE